MLTRHPAASPLWTAPWPPEEELEAKWWSQWTHSQATLVSEIYASAHICSAVTHFFFSFMLWKVQAVYHLLLSSSLEWKISGGPERSDHCKSIIQLCIVFFMSWEIIVLFKLKPSVCCWKVLQISCQLLVTVGTTGRRHWWKNHQTVIKAETFWINVKSRNASHYLESLKLKNNDEDQHIQFAVQLTDKEMDLQHYSHWFLIFWWSQLDSFYKFIK